jgi:hypothetical protein
MKKHFLFGTLILACIPLAGVSAGGSGNGTQESRDFSPAFTRGRLTAESADFRLIGCATAADVSGDASMGASGEASSAAAGKKTVLAAALSAAIPGAGEFYAGSWIKGSVFLAVEVAAWVGYSHYTDKGNRMRTEFRAYADDHWSYDRWTSEYNPNTDPGSHGLPMDNGQIVKTQQYYEMIGKYDQFMMGWEDWTRGGPDVTPLRDAYETMRHNHNHQLVNASRCTMAALTNHLLSAVDAAWTVHRRNRRIRVSLGTDAWMARTEAVPVLSLRVEW